MSRPYPPPATPSGPPPRQGRSTSSIVTVVAVVLVLSLVVVGLVAWSGWALLHDDGSESPSADGPTPTPSASASMPAYPAALKRFYTQKLAWSSCGEDQCTRLTVPLDYARPTGRTIKLAVLRVPATQRAQRVGQLVVNPGGPGGSGVDYAAAGSTVFGEKLTRYYDIVGFDPRGVGRSTPLKCAGTKQTDEFLSTDPDPDTSAEVATLDRRTREYGAGCVSNSGELAKHISTVEVAKDVDVLRAALGEVQLDYFGASYGTFIGATYADLFPTHVRRMVLDGAIDPALTNEKLSLGQAGGFQTAFEAYVRDCVQSSGCPLGSSVAEGSQKIKQLLDRLDADPIRTSSGRDLTEGLATYGIFLPLYNQASWPQLTSALTQVLGGQGGDQLLSLSDAYTSRGREAYNDNSVAALYAVNCLDHSDAIPSSEVPRYVPRFQKVAPVFGRIFAYGLSTCASWPVQSGVRGKPLDAAGAAPIVVVGTTRDPATPYAWAKALAGELDSGHLITRDGDGHTGFRQGNQCVDGAIEGYLVEGTVPRDGLSC